MEGLTVGLSDADRFRSKIDEDGPVLSPELGKCHTWRGSRTQSGYGRFWLSGMTVRAHRLAFFLARGRWPEQFCCHRCDNPSCVNPEHLFEGDHDANMADKIAKGRQAAGESHGRRTRPDCTARGERVASSKLTECSVRDIRANYALCRVTQEELGKRFGVSRALVSAIVRGEAWAHAV